MPARPAALSIVAHITTPVARMPVVTKIFSPLMIHSFVSSSRTAVVDTREGSEPQPGSVIAIERSISPNLAFCSSVPAAASAAFPRPPRIERRSRTE